MLIADETALPAVAALLDDWLNPRPPTVISITQEAADQGYLDEKTLPAGSVLHRISGAEDVAGAVLAYLQTLPQIDTAWGALENQAAKTIRQYLRHERALEGKKTASRAIGARHETRPTTQSHWRYDN